MFSVQHAITIGGATLKAGDASRLLQLETYASFRSPINRCSLVLPADAAPEARPGDAVTVALGYDTATEQVFAGQVGLVEQGLQVATIEAFGAARALTHLYHNAVYEKRAAGAIVGDILGKASLKRGAVEDGVTFTSYAFGANRSLLEQLQELARRCGFDVYADARDQLMFKAYAAEKTHAFAYGEHILAFEATPVQAAVDGVEVYGSSPAGQGQSEEASSWLTKKDVKGAAGKTSGNVVRVIDAASRTQDQARVLAGNLFKTMTGKAAGRARVLGAPAVALGDAVAFSKLPQTAYNATFRITSVRHRLDRSHGFVTEIGWEQR